MPNWSEFAAEAPDLARRVRAAFAIRKHATMATLRRDGSPRISGTEVEFDDDTGELRLGSMPNAVKARDLQRDGRVALHSPTVDPPPQAGGPPAGNAAGWQGEAKVAGTAIEVPGDDGSHRFRVEISEAVLTHLNAAGDGLVVEAWHEGRGVERTERR
jgi:hypothetical protein